MKTVTLQLTAEEAQECIDALNAQSRRFEEWSYSLAKREPAERFRTRAKGLVELAEIVERAVEIAPKHEAA